MADVDAELTYEQLDPSGLGRRIAEFPSQCREAWEEGLAASLPRGHARVERVVVMGMGGSAIGGDLLADLASLEDAPPFTVCREYSLPSYVDDKTLALACSHSGNTEETLSCFRQALERRAKVIAVTSGGTLAKEAQAKGLPLFTVDYQGEPRSALGYMFLAPLALVQKLGLVSDKSGQVAEALSSLEGMASSLAPGVPSAKNPAKQLAKELHGRIVVAYGAGYFGAVARRFKTQINENSKSWAFWELLPELHHNSVVGYPLPHEMARVGIVVMLQPSDIHPQVVKRYQISRELLDQQKVPHRTIEGRGRSPLAQMLTAIHLGDYASYYLALLNDVDPAPVKVIDYVKGHL